MMTDQVVIQKEPPWVVEIEGVKLATPELVCLLLQDVSEERDQLKTENERLRVAVRLIGGCPSVCDICNEVANDALKEGADE